MFFFSPFRNEEGNIIHNNVIEYRLSPFYSKIFPLIVLFIFSNNHFHTFFISTELNYKYTDDNFHFSTPFSKSMLHFLHFETIISRREFVMKRYICFMKSCIHNLPCSLGKFIINRERIEPLFFWFNLR